MNLQLIDRLGQQTCKTQTLTLSGATGNYAWRGLAAPNLLAYVSTRFEVGNLTVPEAAIYLASNPTFGDIVSVTIGSTTLKIDDATPLTRAQWYWPGHSALAGQPASASITYDCVDPAGETQLVRVEWPAPYASLPMLVQRAPTGERSNLAAIISRNNNTGHFTDDPGAGTWDYRLGYLGEWGPWAEIVVPPAPSP